jgi:uncharacterized lipoprotein YddW (UPF0748 family)
VISVLRAAVLAVGLVATVTSQMPEVRGVWVARDGLVSRAKIESTLDQLAAANCNVVCVNVWSRGFTIHPSDVLFAACGQRQDPSFVGRDPLAEFVFEAHRRGIEVEAWFEYGFMFGWSGWYAGPSGTGPVLSANPSWIARDNTGNAQVSDGGTGYFTWASHEHPAVRQFLIALATELVDRYDVDGVQFDRVRYPSTSFGYDATTTAAYQAATGQLPPANVNNSQWKRWRADRLTAFHSDLYAAVHAHRATVRVTDAPTVMPGAYDTYLQDWPGWLIAGSLDLVYPQVYRTTTASYITTLDQQLAAVRTQDRARIAPGIRAIAGTPTADVLGMVAADRVRNLPGHVFWYAEGLYDDLSSLQANYFQTAVAVPFQLAGFRPLPVVREENDPSTTVSAGFLPSTMAAASGGTARLSLPSSLASDHVQFVLPVSQTGLWSVFVHVPAGPGLSPVAPHTIVHQGGVQVARIDQGNVARLGYVDLGTYWLTLGTTTVTVSAVPGQSVVADAVMLLRSRFDSGAMSTVGVGTPGSAGGMRLSMRGHASLAGALQLQANQLPVGAPLAWVLGFQSQAAPLFGGQLLVVPLSSAFALADSFGAASTTLELPFVAGLHGLSLYAQALALDAGAQGGVGLSPAAFTILP